jgi:cob(I)alamin adenosyltransferase
MDGNCSNNEEEEFIHALKNEMPEVFENIETTLTMLKDIDKLIFDVKASLSVEKMTDLKEKVDIASENVDETESLVLKLEKEVIEWNA